MMLVINEIDIVNTDYIIELMVRDGNNFKEEVGMKGKFAILAKMIDKSIIPLFSYDTEEEAKQTVREIAYQHNTTKIVNLGTIGGTIGNTGGLNVIK